MIKFRGVPLDDYSHDANVDFDGTFIYGNYEKVGDDVLISSGKFDLEGVFVPDLFAKVDPKTVGQFIGLKDINGKDIYIGDIVKSFSNVNSASMIPIIGEIVSVSSIGEPGVFLKPAGTHLIEPKVSELFSNYEVIGNIHNNPELMEEDSDDYTY